MGNEERNLLFPSIMIPAIVKALIGFPLGMVIILLPLVMVMCLPCLATQKPDFSNALTAR
jgi:hypothetical protein